MKKLIIASVLVAAPIAVIALICCRNRRSVDNTSVETFDLKSYLGRWFEIARLDHSFERGLSNCIATYTLKSDNTIRVLNQGWNNDNGKWTVSEGKAKTTKTPSLLRVSFFGPFYSDYRILVIDPYYTYALVGSGSGKYLWILSRTPELDSGVCDMLIAEAQRRGYDTSQLIMVDQSKNLESIPNQEA